MFIRVSIITAMSAYAIWFWFDGLNEFQDNSCGPHGFFFANVNLNGRVHIAFRFFTCVNMVIWGFLFIAVLVYMGFMIGLSIVVASVTLISESIGPSSAEHEKASHGDKGTPVLKEENESALLTGQKTSALNSGPSSKEEGLLPKHAPPQEEISTTEEKGSSRIQKEPIIEEQGSQKDETIALHNKDAAFRKAILVMLSMWQLSSLELEKAWASSSETSGKEQAKEGEVKKEEVQKVEEKKGEEKRQAREETKKQGATL